MTALHPLWEQAIEEGRVDRAKAEIQAERFPDVESMTCYICGKLIVPHVEPSYGASVEPVHYNCHREKHGPSALERWRDEKKEFDKKFDEAMGAIGRLREAIGGKGSRRAQMESDFDRQRFDDGPESGPVKR